MGKPIRINLVVDPIDDPSLTKHFVHLKNPLDAGSAFTLLHLLQHLNGVACCDMSEIGGLNPRIVLAFLQHTRKTGRKYAIHSDGYGMRDMDNLHRTYLLPAWRQMVSGNGVGDVGFIRAHTIHVREGPGEVEPEDLERLKKLATTSGAYCRKLQFRAIDFGAREVDDMVQVSWSYL